MIVQESMTESLQILRGLIAKAPRDVATRIELAESLAALTDLEQPGAEECAEEALSIRRALLTERPPPPLAQAALAELLQSLGINGVKEKRHARLAEELFIRTAMLAEAPPASRDRARAEVVHCYEGIAAISDPVQARVSLEKAFVVVDAAVDETSADAAQLDRCRRLVRLGTALAQAARRARETAEISRWVQRLQTELPRLLAAPAGQRRMEVRSLEARARAEIALALAGSQPEQALVEAEKADDSLRTLCRAVRTRSDLAEALEMNRDLLIGLRLQRKEKSRALEVAREACVYWATWSGRGANSNHAAAWFRLAVIQHSLSDAAGAASSLADARKMREKCSHAQLQELVLHLLRRAASAQGGIGLPEQAEFRTHAIEALRILTSDEAVVDSDFFAHPMFAPLEAQPNFQDVRAALQKIASQAAQNNKSNLPIDATDGKAIRAAWRASEHSFGTAVKIKGRIHAVQWTVAKRAARLQFDKVSENVFVAIVRESNRFAIEDKLGGPLETLTGADVTLSGSLEALGTLLEIDLESGDQLIAITRPQEVRQSPPVAMEAASKKAEVRDTAALQAQDAKGIDVTDSAALGKSLGEHIAVRGTIRSAQWSGTSMILNIEFEGAPPDGLLACLFKRDAPNFSAQLGGDPAGVLGGKKVLLRGKLEPYGGKSAAYQGRLQIMLRTADQLTVEN